MAKIENIAIVAIIAVVAVIGLLAQSNTNAAITGKASAFNKLVGTDNPECAEIWGDNIMGRSMCINSNTMLKCNSVGGAEKVTCSEGYACTDGTAPGRNDKCTR